MSLDPQARAVLALIDAGLDRAAIARAVLLLNVDHASTDDAIAAEVESLRADLPGLFEVSGRRGAAPGSRRPEGSGARGRAEERFAEREAEFGDPVRTGRESVTSLEDHRTKRELAQDRMRGSSELRRKAEERFERTQGHLHGRRRPNPGGDAA